MGAMGPENDLVNGLSSESGPRGENGLARENGPARAAARIFRFAAFEVRTETGELYKQGTRLRLQTKPLQILVTLLENPGELVTREQLRQRLWTTGTFVDFESGLNTAINRLRGALGDAADSPRYIETLPRLGYRFICPVTQTVLEPPAPAVQNAPEAPAPASREGAPEPAAAAARPPIFASGLAVGQADLRHLLRAGLVGSGALAGTAALVLALIHFVPHRRVPEFRPITISGESVTSARFLAGAHRLVYSASPEREDRPFMVDVDGSHSRALPVSGVLASVSYGDDLTMLSRETHKPGKPVEVSRASLDGHGTPQLLAEDAAAVDQSPDGKALALVRRSGNDELLEFPAGRVVYRSQGWIDGIRVSRFGRDVAFLEHPIRDDDAGHVATVDAAGSVHVLTRDWSSAEGLAWSPSGNEIWFTASTGGLTRDLYAVSRAGKLRQLAKQPLSLRLLDVAPSGQALLAIDEMRMSMHEAAEGEAARDISRFDYSHIDDISADGKVLLFTEAGDAGGRHYQAYVYDESTHSARSFGQGRGLALSRDGKRALTMDPQNRTMLTITTLATGESAGVCGSGFLYQWARFLEKDDELIVGGAYPSQPLMIAFQNTHQKKPVAVPDAPYLDSPKVSPDGSKIAGLTGGKAQLFDIPTHTTQRILPDTWSMPVAWTADSRSLFLLTRDRLRLPIVKLDLPTQRVTAWREIPSEQVQLELGGLVVAPRSNTYAYSKHLKLSRLYVVDGLS